MSLLLDRYGELLTERQRDLMHRYYEEDLSLGEVAGQVGVSRQAVFDAVKHGEASLEKYESALGLVEGGGIDPKTASRAARRLRRLAEDLDSTKAAPAHESLAREIEAIAEELDSAGESPALAAEGTAQTKAARSTSPLKTKPSPPARPILLRGDAPEFD